MSDMLFVYSPLETLGFLLAGFVIALLTGLLAVLADKIIRGPPKSVWGLRASMTSTVAALILGFAGLLALVANYAGAGQAWIYSGLAFFSLLMLLQWLFSPSIINAVYRTRPPGRGEEWLVSKVEELARKAGLKRTPKLRIAEVDAPNAFAYSSPIKGSYVAVTRGLLRTMPREEITAVLAHEIGHLKHKDVAVILALSLLPVALYYVGRSMLMWGWLAGSRERGNAQLYYMGLGIALAAVGCLFHFIVMHFSRLREYYSDAFSGMLTGAPRSLQRALARLAITYETSPEITQTISKSAALLFIVNYLIDATGGMAIEPLWGRPRRREVIIGDIDRAVEELMRREEGGVRELFSTHPPIPKRLRFLESLRLSIESIGSIK
uniref:Protease HtpX homolog n=1 Tax=Fervidicoccus fontis TaxID=683846 RepID=A0A7J3ZKA8_9CREN